MNTIEVTVYVAGEDADDAQGNFVWLEADEAEQGARENGVEDPKVFALTAVLDFDTMEQVN